MATELENLTPETDVEVEGMRGPKGDKGDSYVLTEADKEEIAQKVDKIIDAETDKTLTLSGKPADAKAAGDEIDGLKADLSEIDESLSSKNVTATHPSTEYDLALSDKSGIAIAIFKNGEIVTKNFDSAEIRAKIGNMQALQTEDKGSLVGAINESLNKETSGLKIINDTGDADLLIADKYGNAVVEFINGGIKTGNFDSTVFEKSAIGTGWFPYQGAEISLANNRCKLTNEFKLNGYTPSTLQGGAIYGDYYFQFDNGQEHCAIYDMNTYELTQLYTFAEYDSKWHCNNANFGNEFYDENDLFPLLYVSNENIDVHNVHVFRVSGTIGALIFTLIQTITWDNPKDTSCYYPNVIVDAENGIIYQICYSTSTYLANPDTYIKLFGYPLPKISDGDVNLHVTDAFIDFQIPSFTATQGCTVKNGIIYVISGLYGNREIHVINPLSQKVESFISLEPMLSFINFNVEPESLFCYKDYLMSAVSSKNILKIEFGRGVK